MGWIGCTEMSRTGDDMAIVHRYSCLLVAMGKTLMFTAVVGGLENGCREWVEHEERPCTIMTKMQSGEQR